MSRSRSKKVKKASESHAELLARRAAETEAQTKERERLEQEAREARAKLSAQERRKLEREEAEAAEIKRLAEAQVNTPKAIRERQRQEALAAARQAKAERQRKAQQDRKCIRREQRKAQIQLRSCTNVVIPEGYKVRGPTPAEMAGDRFRAFDPSMYVIPSILNPGKVRRVFATAKKDEPAVATLLGVDKAPGESFRRTSIITKDPDGTLKTVLEGASLQAIREAYDKLGPNDKLVISAEHSQLLSLIQDGGKCEPECLDVTIGVKQVEGDIEPRKSPYSTPVYVLDSHTLVVMEPKPTIDSTAQRVVPALTSVKDDDHGQDR